MRITAVIVTCRAAMTASAEPLKLVSHAGNQFSVLLPEKKLQKKFFGSEHETIISSMTQERRPFPHCKTAGNKNPHNKNHTKKSSELPN